MSKEYFETRRLTGTISLTLSNKKKWSADKAVVCDKIISTVSRYQNEGYRLTLRQLYYQLVAADIIPNDDVVYKKMSGILDDLRYSGKIDWNAIEDRGRVPYIPYSADGPADAMNDLISQYRIDRMEDQQTQVEVWTEKDAISGILKRVTSEFHVRLVVNKGYSSSSAMHAAYIRFSEFLNAGKNIKLLYFGDHDPSGLDMIRDIKDRILFFIVNGNEVDDPESKNEDCDFFWEYREENGIEAYDLQNAGLLSDSDMELEYEYFEEKFQVATKMHYWNTRFEVLPIGLTMQQINQFNPPPNPAKISDPRAKWYIEQHGEVSYEVDALRPDVMASIVRENILSNIDLEKFEAKKEIELQHTAKMREFAESFK